MFLKHFCSWLWFYKVSSWDGCPGVCHMPCNWDTEVFISTKSQLEVAFLIMLHVTDQWAPFDGQEYCDMGLDSNGCWLGNYCMSIESGGCPSTTGLVTLTKNMKRTMRMTTKMKLTQTKILVRWPVLKKWGRRIFSLCCPTSWSDFAMKNKMNNNNIPKKILSCETPHRNFATSRLWQRLWQRC